MPTEIMDSAMEVEAVVAEDDDDDDEEEDGDEELMEVEATVEEDDDNDEDAEAEEEEDDDDDEDDVDRQSNATGEDEVLASAVVVDHEEYDDDDQDDDSDDETNGSVVEAIVVAESLVPHTPPPTIVSSKASSSTGSSSNGGGGGSRPQGSVSPKSSAVVSLEDIYRNVPADKLAAARDARGNLQETVPTLPVSMAETQVRSFGRLCIQSIPLTRTPSESQPNHQQHGKKFNTTSALYPVGYSCDRYEFSPVHGRILKVRCGILSGESVKQSQKRGGFPVQTDLPDGPIFRIVWGRGVDEDAADEKVDYPFDLYTHSRPLFLTGSSEFDSILKEAVKSRRVPVLPAVAMRVKVRYDKDQFFMGAVASVGEPRSVVNGKKKRTRVDVVVKYDDGVEEKITYPDPDLILMMPGAENEIDQFGGIELTEINGSAVTSVIGESPLHAWGRAVQKLGLIDEVIFEHAMESVERARVEGMREAKDKFDSRPSLRGSSAIKRTDETESRAASPIPSLTNVYDEGRDVNLECEDDSDREPPSNEERLLREKVEKLMIEREAAKEADRSATLALANERINDLGGFMCNPFHDDETFKSQEASWLSIAVRKEKNRMGSTGNKRKIVTVVDLLERNDTFYNPDIEALIEGLPGSEFSDPYVFQAFRSSGSGVKRDWIHEAQIKNEKEVQQRIQRSVETQVKDEQDQEKVVKRKQRDDDRDSRKRQKLTEDEERKKARVDERLSRLDIQVNERLHREAAFQREKVVIVLARNLSREFARRRKAAEILSAQAILDGTPSIISTVRTKDAHPLPKPTNIYNEDAVRVWNFMTTFQSFFLQRGYVKAVPSLQSLQAAVNCLSGDSANMTMASSDAVAKLTELSVALCKPLAASLTRSLFASLIALNPALQKDFGAAFFHGVNATATESKGSPKEADLSSSPSDCLLPVNLMTWQEVARLAFLSDALGELGQSKHEAAHLLRGYRSAGHPNSKESRRLRKTEDFTIAILRQQISGNRIGNELDVLRGSRFWVDVPCLPLSTDEPSIGYSMLETELSVDRRRDSVGLLGCLSLSEVEFKRSAANKERYMEDALVLKDEMERKKLKENEEEDDDEEDEDDDEDEQISTPGKKGKGTKKMSTKRLSKTTGSDNGSIPPVCPSEGVDVIESSPGDNRKVGKETPYDEFCGDVPHAPEVIRRCLSVLRTLAVSGPAEPFLYPVDPQNNPGYYEMLLRPMSLRQVGLELYEAVEKSGNNCGEDFLEEVVVQFGRNVRLIEQNCLTYTNAGPMVVAAGSELMRLFERLLFDWVLAPEQLLPPLDSLDDDKCIEYHASDSDAIVLLCDGCEGKWNVHRLDPPLSEIPKGDWYCARCLSGRWYGTTDPRLCKIVKKEQSRAQGVVKKCYYSYPEVGVGNASLMYLVEFDDGHEERWSLSEVDLALEVANTPVPRVRWLRAVVESPGYSFGVDSGLRRDIVPSPLNPNVSETAAQVAQSSSVFRDTITAAGTLLITDPRDMTSTEWLRLLVLLVMKCSSSDAIQRVVSTMENEAALNISASLETVKKVTQSRIKDILPEICGGEICELTANDWASFRDTDSQDLQSESAMSITHTQPIPVVGKPSSVVLGSDSVEFVEETAVDAAIVPAEVVSDETANVDNEQDHWFTCALAEKAKRQKAIEESFAAFSIKEQMKPTVASFEEDSFSSVVDSSMSSNDIGLNFPTLRSRDLVCAFCGLTDVALGLPLVRVPDEEEWDAVFPHTARNCRPYLIADIPTSSSNETKLAALTIRLDGELFSCSESVLDEIRDGGMLEFTPRSELGFQNELKFRYESGLPFVCGSLSAHESCSISVHTAKKERTVQRHKVRQADLIEKQAGMSCGRTLEIGRDYTGRSYWKFDSDPDALFVCIESSIEGEVNTTGSWYHYQNPENIASVIVSLEKSPVAKELRRSYPMASKMIRDGSWSELILKWVFPKALSAFIGSRESNGLVSNVAKESEPYRVGDDVLVRSKSAYLYWDASIVGVSTEQSQEVGDDAIIDAYEVHYKKFSKRYTEWVKSARVVETNEVNRAQQEELLNERSMAIDGLPATLNILYANEFLHSRDRARGCNNLPDFARIAQPLAKNPSLSDTTFVTVKVALLAIEAALPVGCIDTRETGPWRRDFATKWRSIVFDVVGPAALMQCVIVLEDAISEEWMKEDVSHLRSCLPARWKAVAEATCAALAIRVILLDRAIQYSNVDLKRFSAKKKRPR